MTGQTLRFTHHGSSFTIEADGWPCGETAAAAVIDLQSWTLQLDPAGTAALHDALTKERDALLHDVVYDRDMAPLPALRAAQRRAVQSGLGNSRVEGERPTITLEAAQVSEA